MTPKRNRPTPRKRKTTSADRPAPQPVSGYTAHDAVRLMGFNNRQDAHQSGVLDKIDKVMIGPNIFLYDTSQVEAWAVALKAWRIGHAAGGVSIPRVKALEWLVGQ